MAYSNITLEMYLGGAWVDVSADVDISEPMLLRYGNWEHGAEARVAQTGILTFNMKNSVRNSGAVVGYYSPGHSSCRTGFTRGARVRLTFYISATPYVKFYGKLRKILPDPGPYGPRKTFCLAADWLDELAEHQLSEIVVRSASMTPTLLEDIVDSMPSDAQPIVAPSYGTGIDVIEYAFHDIGEKISGIELARKLVISELGYLDMLGTGVLQYKNRQQAALAASSLTLTTSSLQDIRIPSTLEATRNHVLLTAHPLVASTSNAVIWSSNAVIRLHPGESRTFTVAYVSPSNSETFVGIVDGSGVTPVSTTDYLANYLPDGTGIDTTFDLTVSVVFYATTAAITVTAGIVFTYVTFLQLRAKPVYDTDPVVLEAGSTQTFGRRTLELDLPYQSNPNIAQDLATYLLGQYESLTNRVEEVVFSPHHANDALRAAAMTIEPGAVITVTESVTGVTAATLRVMGVEMEIIGRDQVTYCRWSTEPAFSYAAGAVWILDDATYSVLGTTTKLGLV